MKRHEVSFPPHAGDSLSVVHTFKALADETRVHLVLILLAGERTVGELVEALEAPQSTVSRHLAVLRTAGLVATRRRGTSVHYRLPDSHVGDLVTEAFSHAQHKRLQLASHDADSPSSEHLLESEGVGK